MTTATGNPVRGGFNASAWALTHKSFVGFMMAILLLV